MEVLRSKKCRNGIRVQLIDRGNSYGLFLIQLDGTGYLLESLSSKWDGDLDWAIKRYKGECANQDLYAKKVCF